MSNHASSSTKSTKVELSLIATFCHEGITAYKTILNIKQLIQPFEEQGISYEVILHADNGDEATLAVLRRQSSDPHFRLYENHFGNPSDSRNFCVKEAHGRYISIIDGDDIISARWLIDGYQILEKAAPEPLILHVEYNITFGLAEPEPRLWRMSDSRSDDEDTISMFTRNRWSAGTILPHETALKYPYKRSDHGYGYEDWVFNMDTRHAGIKHKVVPHSVQFYRIRFGSIYNLHSNETAVTDYTEMFATPHMQELARRFENGDFTVHSPNNVNRFHKATSGIMHLGRKVITSIPYVGGLAQRGFNHLKRQQGEQALRTLPKCVYETWLAANQIDGEACPTLEVLGNLKTYSSDYNDQTETYCRLVSQIRKNPDYLFLAPRLAVGGTEKVIVNYLNAFAELHPEWHIVVLAKLPDKHPYQIPPNVDFVDYYKIIEGKADYEIDLLLSRFIVQTKVKRLHILHNQAAYQWCLSHLTLLKDNDYKVYVSQFMYEFNKNPQLKIGFVDPWIRSVYPVLTRIMTDNQPVAQDMIDKDGFAADIVKAHYQPIQPLKSKIAAENSAARQEMAQKVAQRPLRILWASRISPQKRPDLLKAIAEKLDAQKYSIDVYGRCQSPYSKHYFADTPVVNYRGTYNGIESLDLSQYDVFLYTSQTDGLPNVLLEISSYGLPIIASKVGGVTDIVNSETGYPIEMDNVSEYISTLEHIQKHYAEALEKAERAQKIVLERHSWPHFLDQVKTDID